MHPAVLVARPGSARRALIGEPEGLSLDFSGYGGLGAVAIKDITTSVNSENNTPATDFLTQDGTSSKWVLNNNDQYREIASGTPALEWDRVEKRFYLLVEPAATNLQIRSQEFDNAAWATINLSVAANTEVAPDGQTTADTITDNSTNSLHILYDAITLTGDTNVTISRYVKAGTHNYVGLNYKDTAAGEDFISAVFDLSNASATEASETDVGTTAGTIVSTRQTDVGNGWWRVSLSGKISASNGFDITYFPEAATGNTFDTNGYPNYAGSSTTLHLWQAQAELGTIATSPIPTVGSAVTRAIDDVNVATSKFPYSSIGTMYIEFSARVPTSNSTIWDIFKNGTNRLTISVNTNLTYLAQDAGVVQALFNTGAVDADTATKTAFAYANDDFAASKNGGVIVDDTSGTVPSGITDMKLGDYNGGGISLNGRILEIIYLPRRRPNAELIAITE